MAADRVHGFEYVNPGPDKKPPSLISLSLPLSVGFKIDPPGIGGLTKA